MIRPLAFPANGLKTPAGRGSCRCSGPHSPRPEHPSSPIRDIRVLVAIILPWSFLVHASQVAEPRPDLHRHIARVKEDLAAHRSELAASEDLLAQIRAAPAAPENAEAERVTRAAIAERHAAIASAEATLKLLENQHRPISPVRPQATGHKPGSYLTLHRWPSARPLGETESIFQLARAGQTRTIGDPDKYSGFFHRQNGETCAVAAQEQALHRRGVRMDEDTLRKYALAHGLFIADDIKCGASVCHIEYDAAADAYYLAMPGGERAPIAADVQKLVWDRGGTPLGALGNLVRDLGQVPVSSSLHLGFKSAIEAWGVRGAAAFMETLERQELPRQRRALVAALEAKQDVFVTVAARDLWDDPSAGDGLHALAVTAVELDNRDGSVLGYYINDTGTGEERRLVPRRIMEQAWLNDNLHLVHTQ